MQNGSRFIIRKSSPKSSRWYSLAADHKFWNVRYLNRSDCFFSNFGNLNRVTASKLLRKSKRVSNSYLPNYKITKSSSCTERFCVSKTKPLTSGDIELNPGPQQGVNSQTTLSVGSTMKNYKPLDSSRLNSLRCQLCAVKLIFLTR